MNKTKTKELTLRLPEDEFEEFVEIAHAQRMKHQALLYEAWLRYKERHLGQPLIRAKPDSIFESKAEENLCRLVLGMLRAPQNPEDIDILRTITRKYKKVGEDT